MRQVDPQVRAALVARLLALRGGGESLSLEVRRAAAGLGVSDRTVWRWLGRGGDDDAQQRRRRPRYEITDADRQDYADWSGNIAALRRARAVAGQPVPSLRTLQQAFARQLSPGERAGLVEGVAGRRRHEVYLRWEPACRNARWETDHKELPVLVTPPRGARPRKPWVTAFPDSRTRG